MFGAIISGIIGLTGAIISGVQSSKSRKSQEKYADRINQLTEKQWREEMEFRRQGRAAEALSLFQGMVNQSNVLKNTMKNYWSGR